MCFRNSGIHSQEDSETQIQLNDVSLSLDGVVSLEFLSYDCSHVGVTTLFSVGPVE